jgi:hypothetical protein
MPNQTTNPPAPTIKSIADALGITPRRVSQLRQAGMPCDSIEAAQNWRSRKSSAGEISADQLRAARYRLLEEQRQKAAIDNSERRGELVSAAEAYQGGLVVGASMKIAFLRLLNDLPPRLEGCSAVEIFTQMKAAFHDLLRQASASEKFFQSPELDQILADFQKSHPPSWTPNKPKL